MRHNKPRVTSGFTLVELLVVIAIIGVLVALLLPAIQAAREAARRSQCTNQVKQMMTAMLNHESARKVFPSGGITPWPYLEDYLNGPNGAPYGPEKQGLGWAFQILPYLEGQNLFNLKSQAALENATIPLFNCPSRRPPTRNTSGVNVDVASGQAPYLIDYAAAVPFPSNSFKGYPANRDPRAAPWYKLVGTNPDPPGCGEESLWGNGTHNHPVGTIQLPLETTYPKWYGFWGVIVRSNLWVDPDTKEHLITGFYTPISFQQIEDGSSNTFVLSEKRLEPSHYDGDWHDDRGWTGGWDPDGLRSTICTPGPDMDNPEDALPPYGPAGNLPFQFGAAHPAGMVAGFADGSVHFLSYEIDAYTFNCLGHRSDGETIDPGAL